MVWRAPDYTEQGIHSSTRLDRITEETFLNVNQAELEYSNYDNILLPLEQEILKVGAEVSVAGRLTGAVLEAAGKESDDP